MADEPTQPEEVDEPEVPGEGVQPEDETTEETTPEGEEESPEEPEVEPKSEDMEGLEAAADHALEDQHGPGVKNNPNYQAMKEDAMRQINEAAVKNDIKPEGAQPK